MISNELISASNGMIQVFENQEFGQIRTVLIDGNPWFVGKDITDILEYQNGRDALRSHVDDEDRSDVAIYDGRQKRNMTAINESGLYSLVLSSKLPTAKKFKHWVTNDILPSIRKHGVYATDELLNNPELAIRAFQAIKEEREKNRRLEAEKKLLQIENAEFAPKAEYHDNVLNKKGLICTSTIAKDLGLRSATVLNRLLFENRIIYHDASGVWKPYAEYAWLIGYGYADYQSYDDPNAVPLLKWTEKGRKWIIDNLAPNAEKEESKSERSTL